MIIANEGFKWSHNHDRERNCFLERLGPFCYHRFLESSQPTVIQVRKIDRQPSGHPLQWRLQSRNDRRAALSLIKILSTWSGKGSKLYIDAHNSYLSNDRMWIAIVLGAPELRTSCLNFSISEPDRSSDWSSSVRSLAAAPARLPIASRRAAQRAFSAFSLSSKGLLEDWSGSGFSLFFGAVGLATRALIAASLLRSSKGRSLFGGSLCSQRPNPSCWVDDSKNNFSDETTSDQNCSSMTVFWRKMFETSSTNVSAIAPTFAVKSLWDRAPNAITKVGFAKGVFAMASENASSKTGSDKILNVQRSIWAMTRTNKWSCQKDLNLPKMISTHDHAWNRQDINYSKSVYQILFHERTYIRAIETTETRTDIACSQCRMRVGSSSCC